MKKLIQDYSIPVALVLSIAGLLGSLYFSEVKNFIPCVLCWYQRIALYPLVLIFSIAIATRDTGVWRYALPLSVISLGIGVYQLLLVYGVITASSACSVGVSCVAITWSLFGFITIPLLAFLEALIITVILIAYRKYV
jgi:disulfide bond formation protein DsbB